MSFLQLALIVVLIYITPTVTAQKTKISFILKGIERQNLNSSVIDQKIKASSINHWNLLDHYHDINFKNPRRYGLKNIQSWKYLESFIDNVVIEEIYQNESIYKRYNYLNAYSQSLMTYGDQTKNYTEAYPYFKKACPLIEILYGTHSTLTKQCYDYLLFYHYYGNDAKGFLNLYTYVYKRFYFGSYEHKYYFHDMDHLDLLMIRMIQVNKNFKAYQKYLNEAQLTMQMITERDTEAKYFLKFYKSLIKEFGGKGVSHYKHYLNYLESENTEYDLEYNQVAFLYYIGELLDTELRHTALKKEDYFFRVDTRYYDKLLIIRQKTIISFVVIGLCVLFALSLTIYYIFKSKNIKIQIQFFKKVDKKEDNSNVNDIQLALSEAERKKDIGEIIDQNATNNNNNTSSSAKTTPVMNINHKKYKNLKHRKVDKKSSSSSFSSSSSSNNNNSNSNSNNITNNNNINNNITVETNTGNINILNRSSRFSSITELSISQTSGDILIENPEVIISPATEPISPIETSHNTPELSDPLVSIPEIDTPKNKNTDSDESYDNNNSNNKIIKPTPISPPHSSSSSTSSTLNSNNNNNNNNQQMNENNDISERKSSLLETLVEKSSVPSDTTSETKKQIYCLPEVKPVYTLPTVIDASNTNSSTINGNNSNYGGYMNSYLYNNSNTTTQINDLHLYSMPNNNQNNSYYYNNNNNSNYNNSIPPPPSTLPSLYGMNSNTSATADYGYNPLDYNNQYSPSSYVSSDPYQYISPSGSATNINSVPNTTTNTTTTLLSRQSPEIPLSPICLSNCCNNNVGNNNNSYTPLSPVMISPHTTPVTSPTINPMLQNYSPSTIEQQQAQQQQQQQQQLYPSHTSYPTTNTNGNVNLSIRLYIPPNYLLYNNSKIYISCIRNGREYMMRMNIESPSTARFHIQLPNSTSYFNYYYVIDDGKNNYLKEENNMRSIAIDPLQDVEITDVLYANS